MNTPSLIIVIAVLGLCTYGMRLGGVLLAHRMTLSPTLERLLPLGAVALLAALAAGAAFTDSGHFAGVARPVGVLAGVLVAAARAPFVAAVIVAALVAAGLRALGIP